MGRSLDRRRHPLLVVALAAVGAVVVIEVAGAAAAAALLALLVLAMGRPGRWPARRPARTVCVQIPPGFDREHAFDGVFGSCAQAAELVGIPSREAGLELQDNARLQRGRSAEGLAAGMRGVVDEGRAIPGRR